MLFAAKSKRDWKKITSYMIVEKRKGSHLITKARLRW